MDWVEWTVAALGTALVGLLVYALYSEAHAEHFSLRKDQWQCTASHIQHSLVPAGKVLVPTQHSVCDKWERK